MSIRNRTGSKQVEEKESYFNQAQHDIFILYRLGQHWVAQHGRCKNFKTDFRSPQGVQWPSLPTLQIYWLDQKPYSVSTPCQPRQKAKQGISSKGRRPTSLLKSRICALPLIFLFFTPPPFTLPIVISPFFFFSPVLFAYEHRGNRVECLKLGLFEVSQPVDLMATGRAVSCPSLAAK